MYFLPVLRMQPELWLSKTHPNHCQQPDVHSNVIRFVGTAYHITEHKTFEEANELMLAIAYQTNYQQDHSCKSTRDAAQRVSCFIN
jgi:hypothetical protein